MVIWNPSLNVSFLSLVKLQELTNKCAIFDVISNLRLGSSRLLHIMDSGTLITRVHLLAARIPLREPWTDKT